MLRRSARAIHDLMVVLALLTIGHGRVDAQGAPSTPASEGEEKARAHFRLGRAYYENGDFAQAAVEFEAAYASSQRAGLLYNIYLAYRDANDTHHAAEALRKYLELEPNIENRGQLEARLAALDRTLAEEAAQPASTGKPPAAQTETAPGGEIGATPVTASPPMAAAPEPAGAPAPATESSPATRSSPDRTVPIVLMASGGALVVGSLVTGVLALGKRSDLADAEAQCKKLGTCNALSRARVDELDAERSSGKTLAIVTDVLLFGGLAVAATGFVLFLVKSGREERPESSAPSASLICAPGACAGRLQLHF